METVILIIAIAVVIMMSLILFTCVYILIKLNKTEAQRKMFEQRTNKTRL